MEKTKEKLTFSNIEILFVIVMLALVIVAGIAVFSITTAKRNVENFRADTIALINIASNAYANLEKSGLTNYITTGSDGTTKGMCITIEGLKANDFLTQEYKDWNGYIVIEEASNKKLTYTAWVTNKKYVINGYSSILIKDLTTKNGIEAYNNDNFPSKVTTSFTGTSGSKGGTGSTDGSSLKRYEMKCINEKIE